MAFSENIKTARKAKGMTQAELAAQLGVSNTTISNWEKGVSRPDINMVEFICGVLEVSPRYLLSRDHNKAMMADIFSIPVILPMPKMKKVPLLGDIACGEPVLAIEKIDEFVDADEDIDCDFALACKGDSMINARIFDGDIVYVRNQPIVENGEIAAVCIDGEATLKRVYQQPDYLELRAENPMYKPLVYRGAELEQVRILGKAIWFKSMVR